MVDSDESCFRSSFRTVSPPTPESNTPMGREERGRAPPRSPTARLLALLRDEGVREVLDRLAHRRGRRGEHERLLLVERLAHDLPVRRDLGDDGQVERVLEAALG